MSHQGDVGLIAIVIGENSKAHEALKRICAEYEALMAPAKATYHSVNDMLRIGKISEDTHRELIEADHACRAAGIRIEDRAND
jgi:hypothetical protein